MNAARENRRDASVTGADRLTTTNAKTAVNTTMTSATGHATMDRTTTALRTTTTIRNTPQWRLSIPSISAHENALNEDATSPAGWSTCQR